MAVLDLKPLNKETIQKLGLSNHDLWIVKIGEDISGPFESESLKHFAAENEELFDEALATRLELNDWQPFFNHALFQRRHPQVVKKATINKEGPFWILDHGQKVGPLSMQEVDKRIELGSLGFVDLISNDEGHTWHKLYEIEGFDRRFHSGSELPFAPLESQFQKARLELLEKIEAGASMVKPSEELAEMAHHTQAKAKVIPFRAEDIPLKPASDTPISAALKWQIPVAIGVVFSLFLGVKLAFEDSVPEEMLAQEDAPSVKKRPKLAKAKQKLHAPNPSAQMPIRSPASYRPAPNFNPAPPPEPTNYHNDSQYPTHMETHQNDYPQEIDPIEPPHESEIREPASEEHSLVKQGQPDDNATLDAVMNGQPVEESSDF